MEVGRRTYSWPTGRQHRDRHLERYPAGHPPTAAKTITASAKPAIHNGNQASGLPDAWKVGLNEGDVLRINVESCTNLKRATLSLKVAKSV